jgi:creatinine amidohydrolase/Fe(II)-dependent formamide hydrolase-like protein
LTLALAPELVRRERLGDAARQPGVRGDPARASVALGEEGVQLIVRDTTTAVRQMQAQGR